MGVYGNNKTAIPIDVIDTWGIVPREVIFTTLKIDGKIVVTIEPALDEPTKQATMQELLIPSVDEKK